MSALPGKTAYNMIEFFTKKSPQAKWFTRAEIVEKSGAIVEVYSPMKIPYHGHILIVGDAACYAECLYQGATMCGYMAAHSMEKELKGEKGFKDYTNWWNSTFEWNKNPQRMADYGKRVFFPRFFTSDEIDFLFNLSKKHPAIADEMGTGVYDYINVLADYFISLPGVSGQLKEKMKLVKEADMAMIATVISKRKD
jgi:flavin-dependent dehydrogenase